MVFATPSDAGEGTPQYHDGDWVVAGSESYTNEIIILKGNLTVPVGTALTLINTTVSMDCSFPGEYHIEVLGTMILQDGGDGIAPIDPTDSDPSIITANNTANRPGFMVRDGATFDAQNSIIEYVGVQHYGIAGLLQGGNIPEDDFTVWNNIRNGSFRITIDGVSEDISDVDFSSAVSIPGVAAIIQQAIRNVGTGGFNTAICQWFGGAFQIMSGTTNVDGKTVFNSTVAMLEPHSLGIGTDISGITESQQAILTGGLAADTNMARWNAVTDGSFQITIDGTTHDIATLSFAAAGDMDAVALTIQNAMQGMGGSFYNAGCEWVGGRFEFTSGATGAATIISALSPHSGGLGTDISGTMTSLGAVLEGDTDEEDNPLFWATVTDGEFAIDIAGNTQNIGPINFTGVVTMDDVALRIQNATRAIATPGFTGATCVWNGVRFIISSGAGTPVASISPCVPTGTGTDISGVAGSTFTAMLGTHPATFTNISLWNNITAGSFEIFMDGVSANITGLNFSAVTNMGEVAAILETAIQAVGTGGFAGATCAWAVSQFQITSGTTGLNPSVGPIQNNGIGDDISGETNGTWMGGFGMTDVQFPLKFWMDCTVDTASSPVYWWTDCAANGTLSMTPQRWWLDCAANATETPVHTTDIGIYINTDQASFENCLIRDNQNGLIFDSCLPASFLSNEIYDNNGIGMAVNRMSDPFHNITGTIWDNNFYSNNDALYLNGFNIDMGITNVSCHHSGGMGIGMVAENVLIADINDTDSYDNSDVGIYLEAGNDLTADMDQTDCSQMDGVGIYMYAGGDISSTLMNMKIHNNSFGIWSYSEGDQDSRIYDSFVMHNEAAQCDFPGNSPAALYYDSNFGELEVDVRGNHFMENLGTQGYGCYGFGWDAWNTTVTIVDNFFIGDANDCDYSYPEYGQLFYAFNLLDVVMADNEFISTVLYRWPPCFQLESDGDLVLEFLNNTYDDLGISWNPYPDLNVINAWASNNATITMNGNRMWMGSWDSKHPFYFDSDNIMDFTCNDNLIYYDRDLDDYFMYIHSDFGVRSVIHNNTFDIGKDTSGDTDIFDINSGGYIDMDITDNILDFDDMNHGDDIFDIYSVGNCTLNLLGNYIYSRRNWGGMESFFDSSSESDSHIQVADNHIFVYNDNEGMQSFFDTESTGCSNVLFTGNHIEVWQDYDGLSTFFDMNSGRNDVTIAGNHIDFHQYYGGDIDSLFDFDSPNGNNVSAMNNYINIYEYYDCMGYLFDLDSDGDNNLTLSGNELHLYQHNSGFDDIVEMEADGDSVANIMDNHIYLTNEYEGPNRILDSDSIGDNDVCITGNYIYIFISHQGMSTMFDIDSDNGNGDVTFSHNEIFYTSNNVEGISNAIFECDHDGTLIARIENNHIKTNNGNMDSFFSLDADVVNATIRNNHCYGRTRLEEGGIYVYANSAAIVIEKNRFEVSHFAKVTMVHLGVENNLEATVSDNYFKYDAEPLYDNNYGTPNSFVYLGSGGGSPGDVQADVTNNDLIINVYKSEGGVYSEAMLSIDADWELHTNVTGNRITFNHLVGDSPMLGGAIRIGANAENVYANLQGNIIRANLNKYSDYVKRAVLVVADNNITLNMEDNDIQAVWAPSVSEDDRAEFGVKIGEWGNNWGPSAQNIFLTTKNNIIGPGGKPTAFLVSAQNIVDVKMDGDVVRGALYGNFCGGESETYGNGITLLANEIHADIRNVDVYDNRGAGIYIRSQEDAVLNIADSTIHDNYWHGLFVMSVDGVVDGKGSITNVQITGNGGNPNGDLPSLGSAIYSFNANLD
ncbi:MAG: DUF3383 family protein, partial [Thermoplasmata archaeon]